MQYRHQTDRCSGSGKAQLHSGSVANAAVSVVVTPSRSEAVAARGSPDIAYTVSRDRGCSRGLGRAEERRRLASLLRESRSQRPDFRKEAQLLNGGCNKSARDHSTMRISGCLRWCQVPSLPLYTPASARTAERFLSQHDFRRPPVERDDLLEHETEELLVFARVLFASP